jgi:hypothetical protein
MPDKQAVHTDWHSVYKVLGVEQTSNFQVVTESSKDQDHADGNWEQ